MKKLLAIIIVAVALIACNNAGEEKQTGDTTSAAPTQAEPRPKQSTDTSVAHMPNSGHRPNSGHKPHSGHIPPDTSVAHPRPHHPSGETIDSKKRSAVLGYSAFKTMRQHETRNINVWVSIINPAAKIIDTLRQLNSEDLPIRKSDTATYFSENISVYRYLDIRLIDPNEDFDITQIHDSARQEIDSLADCHWQWAVTPHTDKRRATLMLKVVAESADGSHKPFTEQNIVIDISLDRNVGRPLFSWLRDNPEKLLVIIIIPLIVFFWKQIVAFFGRKPKKK